ncbi:hypothetical protein L484_005117 [Morus notabilis]|uniref:Aminotransferase-like plant mobile domain-containing protein n=1 Tax=Morus notabilis TaxID=981085 RepID=W9S4B7_9ROSA|nr:hypothetical protein L484_005117 [Morus notabilis]
MAIVADPGPIDKSVLYDQENHVSSAVWDGQERGVLRCHQHPSMLVQWKLTRKQIELVEKAGFGYLRLIPSFSLDNSLISALTDRWRRETNTFHLPVGEMTITLEDVGLILGLAIEGNPVVGPQSNSPSVVCEKLLGKAPEDLNGGMLKLTWLKKCFSKCPEDASTETIERYTRAYIPTGNKAKEKVHAEVKDLTKDTESEAKRKVHTEVKDWLDHKQHIVDGVDDVDESEYMQWYEKITRKFIRQPKSLESEFQRTVAAIKEIGSIVDSVLIDRMDSQDMKLLNEIKNFVHSCLTEIIGEPRKGRHKSAAKRKRSSDSNRRDETTY